jgi:hypothetical protein
VGRVGLRRGDLARARDRGPDGAVVLDLVDHPLLAHVAEDVVAALLRGDRVRDRVVLARRRDDPGQQRRLLGSELERDPLAAGVVLLAAEVGPRGRLDPVRAVPEVHGVQVLGEDLRLGPAPLEVVGERRLLELLEDRPLTLGVEGVLHELLGDRRAALHRLLALHVLPEGARDAGVVDALVLVEAPVLDRDHGVLHVRRDLRLPQQDAVLVVRQLRDLLLAVGGDQRGVAGGLELRRVLERRKLVGDRHHHPEDGRDQREQREAGDDQQQPQLLDLPLGPLNGVVDVRASGARWSQRYRRRFLHPSGSGAARATSDRPATLASAP